MPDVLLSVKAAFLLTSACNVGMLETAFATKLAALKGTAEATTFEFAFRTTDTLINTDDAATFIPELAAKLAPTYFKTCALAETIVLDAANAQFARSRRPMIGGGVIGRIFGGVSLLLVI